MTTWIIDDGPLGHFAKIVPIGDMAGWPKGRLLVAEQTALDASTDAARNELLTADDTPFQSFTIVMDTPAADIVFHHLRRTGRPRNGESC